MFCSRYRILVLSNSPCTNHHPECPIGRYGKDCMQLCRCQNGGSCDPITGKCQCLQGWKGWQWCPIHGFLLLLSSTTQSTTQLQMQLNISRLNYVSPAQVLHALCRAQQAATVTTVHLAVSAATMPIAIHRQGSASAHLGSEESTVRCVSHTHSPNYSKYAAIMYVPKLTGYVGF